MSLTQHELVDRLGISRGTLHRVLTNSPLVKASTRDRVLEEVKRLNYVPNVIARGLKTRRTKSIGIIGPAAVRISNIDKINAIHLAARELGYSILLGYSDGSSEEDARCIRELRARMVDGLIALGRGLPQGIDHYKAVLDSHIPLVTLYPIQGLETDCVYVDTRREYAELTSYLIKLGHTNIGLLMDGSRSLYSVNRELGFEDAMRAAGLSVNKDWIVHVTPDGTPLHEGEAAEKSLWSVSDYQYGFWGASLLLAKRQRPTALVCFSDEYAIGALRAAQLAGIDVPGDLALVGYDDKEAAKFARVPLTTMHQPDDEHGQEAVSLLIKRIEGKLADEKPVVRSLRTKLVIRESCGAAMSKK